MESSLGWVDFSSVDKDRIKNVLNLLSEPGTVDELGIGSIRDSFSDTLFPGISTLQTRAKYFITIPRIIKDYEKMSDSQRKKVGGLERYMVNQEDECARLFAKPFTKLPSESQKGTGIIGITALEAGVLRKPSELYWGGLRTFGLICTQLSRAEFCRLLDKPVQAIRVTLSGLETEKGDDRDAVTETRLVRLPDYDPKWLEKLDINLTNAESVFLIIQMNHLSMTGSLLSDLLHKKELRELVLTDGVSFHNLPEILKDHVSSSVHSLLKMACDFWTIMEGAHIRYNCLLQKEFGTSMMQNKFEEQWLDWCNRLKCFDWAGWNVSNLWPIVGNSGHKVRDYTKNFVEQWCKEIQLEIIRSGRLDKLNELVVRQESVNKSGKSRLTQTGISVREWIGISNLNYRFPQVRRIMKDLQDGMALNA